MRPIALAFIVSFLLAGCTDKGAREVGERTGGASATRSVLQYLRPKASPEYIARVAEEERLRAQAGQLAAARPGTAGSYQLPEVSMAPLAPPAEMADGPIVTPVGQEDKGGFFSNLWPFGQQEPGGSQTVASYDSGASVPPPPPGAAGGGLVPPPPAISLSTHAQALPYDPYANPYVNPYYPPSNYAQPVEPPRPAGSLFASGRADQAGLAETTSLGPDRHRDFVPITPTGMEPRSAYKVRDDLKVLWSGAVASSQLGALASRDEKIARSLMRVSVSLPGQSTKGAFNVSAHQVAGIFKPVPLDKQIQAAVVKIENDVVQSYYRYLYAYDKYALAQQTVAARKEELAVALTSAEKQRAAADLAQAKSQAGSAREDMRAAEYELASVAGAAGARTVIGRVSGVTPSLAILSQAESAAVASADEGQGSGLPRRILGLLGLSKSEGSKEEKKAEGAEVEKADKKVEKKEKKEKKEISEIQEKRLTAESSNAFEDGERETHGGNRVSVGSTGQAAVPDESGADRQELPVAFELKKVKVLPRKSVLDVAICNHGKDSFVFNPGGLSVAEGKSKLSPATVRADFESTSIPPQGAVSGTITIFGRPWNDRLTVSLSQGSASIQMRR